MNVSNHWRIAMYEETCPVCHSELTYGDETCPIAYMNCKECEVSWVFVPEQPVENQKTKAVG